MMPEANGAPCKDRYQRLYAMLLDAIPSSVLLIDQDIRIVSANRNFLERSRRSLADTIGQRLQEVFPPVILDYMDISRRMQQVFLGGEPTGGERLTYRAPGIPLRIYYYRILPFTWKAKVENVMLLMEDITEQVRLSEEVRRVERHLASVVESASDMVLSTDIEGRILTWNPAAEKISGYAFEEVSESPFPQFFTEDHREEVRQTLSHLHYTSSTRLGSWELLKKDGSRLQVSWVCSPMKNDLGQTVAMVALGRDQTEQRKLEAQLMQSQKLAALGVMAGGIAHEIRNPLAICSSAAQFLLEEGLTPQFIRECAQRLQSGIHKASNIIENLLRFARPSESLETAPVDLAATLQEPLALVANQAKLQKVAIKLRLPREPVVSNGVASLLQQVFMNLYLNALHAMPQGGAITVTLEKGEGEAVVRVADTGRGIAPEDLGKIFDPFYTRSPVGRGIGLGLSITYSIVQQHLGAVEVESQVGRGSTFLVRLPLG